MQKEKRMSSKGSSSRGRAVTGQDTKPFFDAVRARAGYRKSPDTSTDKTAVYADDGRRRVKVGNLFDGTLTKSVEHKHILRKPAGIALQESALYQLKALHCHTVRIIMPDKLVLFAPLERFLTKGVHFDRGFGAQIVLPMTLWEEWNTPQARLF